MRCLCSLCCSNALLEALEHIAVRSTDLIAPLAWNVVGGLDAELLDSVMHMAISLGPDVFVAQSEALRLREDLRSGLGRLTMPVMLSCGSEDRLCPPEWHRAWANLIGTNASFDEIQNAGHLLPLEQPGALADALIGWLEKEALCQTVS